MKNKLVIIAVIIASITLTAGIVKAASLTVDSLTVGKQGVGGVTFFNGTIINNTTTNGADNPVTFGDNVRIDGSVYRGAKAGTGDNKPFKINDDGEVVGNLTVDKNLTTKGNSTITGDSTVGGNSTVAGNLGVKGSVYGGYTSTMFDQTPLKIDDQVEITCDLEVGGSIYRGGASPGSGPINDGKPVRIDDNLVVTGEIFAIGGLDTLSYGGGVKISGGELSVEGYVDLGRTIGQPPNLDCAGGSGRMKFDPYDNKLWVCGNSGWKSFSAD